MKKRKQYRHNELPN